MRVAFVSEYPRNWIIHAVWTDTCRLVWLGPLRLLFRFPTLDDLREHSEVIGGIEDVVR